MKSIYNQYVAKGNAMELDKIKTTFQHFCSSPNVNSIHKFNNPLIGTVHILLSYLISEQYLLQNSRMLTL
jgi:hypothetical protein